MSEDSLNLVLQNQANKSSSDMAKVQINPNKSHLLAGYFPLWSNLMLMLFYPK